VTSTKASDHATCAEAGLRHADPLDDDVAQGLEVRGLAEHAISSRALAVGQSDRPTTRTCCFLQRLGDVGQPGWCCVATLVGVEPRSAPRRIEVAGHLDLTDALDRLQRTLQLVRRDVGAAAARANGPDAHGE